jgi:hypothetical protein
MDPTQLPQGPYGPRFRDGVRQEPSMKRRTFMALVSGGLLAAPLTAEAQQAGHFSVLWLAASSPRRSRPMRSSRGKCPRSASSLLIVPASFKWATLPEAADGN